MVTTKPHPMVLILALLGLFFSLGDLIGEPRLAAVEHAWRTLARRLLERWVAAFTASARWIAVLVRYAVTITTCAAAVTSLWYFEGLLFVRWSLRRFLVTDVAGGIAVLVMAIVGAISARRFVRTTISTADSAPDGGVVIRSALLPLEVRVAREVLLPIARIAYSFDKENSFSIGGVFVAFYVVLPFAGLLLPLTIFATLILRLAVAGVIMTVWVALFAPSLLLHWLSSLTGGTSYFKFGKYLVLTVSAIWLLWQWW